MKIYWKKCLFFMFRKAISVFKSNSRMAFHNQLFVNFNKLLIAYIKHPPCLCNLVCFMLMTSFAIIIIDQYF